MLKNTGIENQKTQIHENMMMNENRIHDRVTLIKTRLKAALNPDVLLVEDESAEHAGHAGARQSGGGHFHVTLVSTQFEGKGLLARHRLVYNALEGLIGPEIHALQIVAKTPLEYGG